MLLLLLFHFILSIRVWSSPEYHKRNLIMIIFPHFYYCLRHSLLIVFLLAIFVSFSTGEIAKIHCSPDYAYGAGGFPAWGIMPNSELIFEIEVLSYK